MTQPAEDLIPWFRTQLDKEAAALTALDSTDLNGIESTAGPWVRAYVERGLAEVEAKRRIIDWLEHDAGFDLPATKTQAMSRDEWSRVFTARTTIKLMAEPLAARPGYREEWRP